MHALRFALSIALATTLTSEAHAFVHVVEPGETLASIAERIYGRIQHERILVAANELDLQGGLMIVPGMRLEVPAVSYRRVRKGDTWQSMAAEHLGTPKRADVLAISNGTNPWLPVDEGAEIVIPYNLLLVATQPDTLPQVAFRYLGDAKKAWMLEQYNGKKQIELARGDAILVPLTDLPLTEAGKKEAAAATAAEATEAHGETRTGQRRVAGELPVLMADVRNGRYVDAVRRGNGFLGVADLTHHELVVIHRQLLEAYVALGATGLAAAECEAWRKLEPNAGLDPIWISPKILAACQHGGP
jgi:hypothetical protein